MADQLTDTEIVAACARAMGFQSPEQFADDFFHDYNPLHEKEKNANG